MSCSSALFFFILFFLTDAAPTRIYTLSLHDALPISRDRDRQRGAADRGHRSPRQGQRERGTARGRGSQRGENEDRKSTRLNSSHITISYAVFCLKKKNK